MHHRRADRIKAHVLLRWLALLLIGQVELKSSQSWTKVRREMDRLHPRLQ